MSTTAPKTSGRALAIRRCAWALFLLVLLLPGAGQAGAQEISRRPFGDSLSTYHTPRQRTYHLEHVLLNLTLDERQKSISGTSTLTLRPLNAGLDTVELDSAELRILSVTQTDGARLVFDQTGGKLRVHLKSPAGPADSITVAIAYEGKPRKGIYFIGPDSGYPDKPPQIWSQGETEDSHFWFPVYDYPNDKATSEGYYTVNSDYTVISNGRLVGVEDHPSLHTKTYHWKEDVPHSTYLISVVAGKFEKYTDKAGDVPLEYYVPPGTGRDKALRSFHETPDAIRFFASKIGVPYPYPKYSQVAVHDFVFGGMENISASTLSDRTLHDQGSEPQNESVDLVTHELAHQWFGDLLTCADWADIWLNEGFATFWADLYREHRFGEQEYRYSLYQEEARYLEEDRQRYRRPMVTSYYTDPLDVFDHTTYEKGSLVLDMLRFVLGDDKFFAAITLYTKEHEAGNVVTDDLRKSFEKSSGEDLRWFFDEWTAKAGYPELEVQQQWNDASRTLHLVVEQTQAVDDETPLFRMPVEVEFSTPSGSTRKRIELSGSRDEFDFVLDAKPSMVRFDPDHRLLATVKFPKPVSELIYQWKNDPSVVGQIWASKQLAQESEDPEVTEALRRVLVANSFWGVKEAAAKALGGIKTAAARNALAEGLRDADPRVRQASVRALASFRDDSQAATLVEGEYDKDQNTLVEAEAALSLGRIRSKDARKLLEQAVQRKSDGDVIRRYALRGLGDLGDKKEWDVVARRLAYGEDPETRMAAVDALTQLGNEHDGKTAVRLIALVDDPDLYVKQRAISALGEGNYQQARAALMNSAQSALDSRVRRSARIALDRLSASAPDQSSPAEGQTHFQSPTQPPRVVKPQAAAFAGQ